MHDLAAGAHAQLPTGVVQVRLSGPFDLSALVVSPNGKVGGDGDFVFFNQPSAPGVQMIPAGPGAVGGGVSIEPARLRPGAARVVLVASPADGATPFGRLPVPAATVHNATGAAVIRLVPPRLGPETALLLGEIYRRSGDTAWRVRSVGQGYADGLAGLARDFGVVVDEQPSAAAPPPAPMPPRPTAPPRGVAAAGVMPPGVPPPLISPRPEELEPAHEADHLAAQGRARVFGVHGGSASPAPPWANPWNHARGGWGQPGYHGQPGPYGQPYGGQVGPYGPPAQHGGDPLAEVVALTNQQRQLNGLSPLSPDVTLGMAAAQHSADMAQRRFFDHRNPDGRQVADRVTALGYRYTTVAENIARGQHTAAEVVTGWMNSPGHRRNILLPEITQIGVGYAPDSVGYYWTQVFGSPRAA